MVVRVALSMYELLNGIYLIAASAPARKRKSRAKTTSEQLSSSARPNSSSSCSTLPAETQTPSVFHFSPAEPQPQLSDDLQTESACPHCFLHPCVASLPAEWLGRGQRAHTANSSIRRVMYGKYWKMIYNLGGWTNELYVAKKLTETHGVHHMREIMPDCVVVKVRTLYPNPVGIPYLGHKWE